MSTPPTFQGIRFRPRGKGFGLVWLWRPQRKAPSPVLEQNYRCCCNLFPATLGFKALTIFLALLMLISWPSYIYMFFTTNLITIQQWIFLIFMSGFVALGMIAIQTMAPYFIQLYLMILAFSTGLVVVTTNFLLLLNLFAYFGDSYEARFQIKRIMGLNGYQITDHVMGYMLLGLFFFIFLYLIIAIWQLKLVYSFHLFVCDRQLEMEENGRKRTEIRGIEESEVPLNRHPTPYVV
ncbi:unnamed protein product, partial [Mesorhabditis belari]|uniref:NADH dehydrogenase subunit 6 n=1 Tax=Mesorhabditis belari TaxID=2138241 RepID=A0AAF3JAG0_9BILA